MIELISFNVQITVLQLILYHANSLQITSLYVPGGASHEAPMDCRYDLEGGKLYDVKWYKDGEQFYRCMENGSVQEFPVDGVKIYHTKTATSGSCPLTVTNLTPKSAGEYKCEVSLDEPSFKIVSQWARMRFIESSRRVQNRSIDNSIGNLLFIFFNKN